VSGIVAIVAAAALAAGYEPPTSQGLRHAHGFDWLCAGADRESCIPGHVPKKLFRPLHLPTLAPGAPCPGAKQVGIYRRQWRSAGTYTRVRAAGCYAYQIDGTTFSRVVVFRAVPST
jgi:hypothetical protein